MVNYESFTLSNGLEVYVHEDFSTPLCAVNVVYDVGSRDEDENKTGFAHLFEHLMFGGSKHIINFDDELQKVGGNNNAFTCADYTSYYSTLPAANIETAFWLESDRMLSLSFDPKVLEVQRSVVMEEFKQMYLNQPYGDSMLLLRPLAYTKHPYRWATIGKSLDHIEHATMDDVKSFFAKHYCPANAKLIVGGSIKTDQVKELAEKWFGSIPSGEKYTRSLPLEPKQETTRKEEVTREVPGDALYMSFHMEDRFSESYYATDLLSDIFGRGASSRLTQSLIKEKELFNSISSYVTGSHEPGLFMISGKIKEGVTMDTAYDAVLKEITEIREKGISEGELQKVKNQAISSIAFSRIELMDKVMALAHGIVLGRPELVNEELDGIKDVTVDDVNQSAKKVLNIANSSSLFYRSKN